MKEGIGAAYLSGGVVRTIVKMKIALALLPVNIKVGYCASDILFCTEIA